MLRPSRRGGATGHTGEADEQGVWRLAGCDCRAVGIIHTDGHIAWEPTLKRVAAGEP